MQSYFEIYDKFVLESLPKTNYDIYVEQEKDCGMQEKDLLEHLGLYRTLIKQDIFL